MPAHFSNWKNYLKKQCTSRDDDMVFTDHNILRPLHLLLKTSTSLRKGLNHTFFAEENSGEIKIYSTHWNTPIQNHITVL